MQIGTAFRILRVRFNLSQAELAEKTGIKGVQEIENGRSGAALEDLAKLAQMLGVTVSALIKFCEDLDDASILIPQLLTGAVKQKKLPSGKATRSNTRIGKKTQNGSRLD